MKRLLINLGIYWYIYFDNGFLFPTIKELKIYYRYTFYIFLNLFVFLAFYFTGKIIDVTKYTQSVEIINFLNQIGYVFLFGSLFFSIWIFTYELLYKEDIQSLLEEHKKRKKSFGFFKISFKYRVLLYFMSIFFSTQFLYSHMINYFITSNIGVSMENNTLIFNSIETQKKFELFFNNDLKETLYLFIFIYLVILISLEIFASFKRRVNK
jgi:hypothetical protein